MKDIEDGLCRAHPGKSGQIHAPANRKKVISTLVQYHDYAQVFCYGPDGECARAPIANSLSCFSMCIDTLVLKAG